MALNRTIAVKASAAVTASAASSTFSNRDSRGITVKVKNTAGSGTSPTVTVKLQEYTVGAGWVDVTGATTAAIAGGSPATTEFTVYPGMTVGSNSGVSRPLGKSFRLYWTIGGSNTPSVTFSVDAELHA
jgi:hypothetical protein